MKNLLWLCLIAPVTLLGQTFSLEGNGNTWAVIVGISQYADPEISDLKYADADALAFKAYLESPAGGLVPPDHIDILLNEEATTAKVASAIDALIGKAKQGDQAIIYFSGHGDVETNTSINHGFLLTHNAPSRNYIAGAYPMFYLQSVISTLSQANQTKVILISDACRSGTLAGMSFNGPQLSARFLQQQFANEVKILACGPKQYSMEGEQWGGGHGAFSYHLLEGLQGLADSDEDFEITLYEIRRYLEDKVPAETAPTKQFPQTVGDLSVGISLVDPDVLADLRFKKQTEQPTIAMVETKGAEATLVSHSDTSTQALYDRFQASLNEKRLLFPEKDCAYFYFLQLKQKADAKPLVELIQRNLAVTLQDEAQEAINAYLKADPEQMKRRWSLDPGFDHYPLYLEKSVELLGTTHYMAPNLNAKKLYFEAVNLRMQADHQQDQLLYQKALLKIEQALDLEPGGAFLHNEKGLIHSGLGETGQEESAYLKAHELAPAWIMPANNLGLLYHQTGRPEKAVEWGAKAVSLKPDFATARTNLGVVLLEQSKLDEAEEQLIKALELEPEDQDVLLNLSTLYYKRDNLDQATSFLNKILALAPEHPDANYSMANIHYKSKNYPEAEAFYQKVLQASPSHPYAPYGLGRTFEALGKTDQAITRYEQSLEVNAAYLLPAIRISSLYASRQESEKALSWLEKALQMGYTNRDRILEDEHLKSLIGTDAFEQLMDKYF